MASPNNDAYKLSKEEEKLARTISDFLKHFSEGGSLGEWLPMLVKALTSGEFTIEVAVKSLDVFGKAHLAGASLWVI